MTATEIPPEDLAVSTIKALTEEVLRLREERDTAFAAGFEAAREAVAAATRLNCPECKGTGQRDSGGTYPWGEGIFLACDCDEAIRALTPSDASEALAARDRQMRAEGMRKAAKIADDMWENFCSGVDEKFAIQECEARICAAADKDEK